MNEYFFNKDVHYKYLEIEFTGKISGYSENTNRYKINGITWIGLGYPHLEYWLTTEEIMNHCKFI